MIPWLLALHIDTLKSQILMYGLAAIVLAYLSARRPWRSLLLRSAAPFIFGIVVGLIVVWLVSDVVDVFGVSMSLIVRMWVALAFGGVAVALANLWKVRWWRKVIAIASIPVFLASAAVGINIDFGAYRTLNDALGIDPYSALPAELQTSSAGTMNPTLGKTWRAPSDLPARGDVKSVLIPGTLSHFPARAAVVYLPPAALVARPPVLPVLIMFSGQPGDPSGLFTSGHIAEILDAYAARHGGLAPIVVAPDQLGFASKNPMCIDSSMGNVETYVTVDVVNWVRSHLLVSDSGRYWAVGGYSEGGTCSIQFGAGHPELFGTIVDILGEKQPTIGSDTVSKVFGGSSSAYDAIKPMTLLDHHAPYSDSMAFFGAGQREAKYNKYAHEMRAAAQAAGMATKLIVSPNSGHDWNTVRYVFSRALPDLMARLGLGS
ncbi:MAG: alpha/beta hydrolase-fold protein [Terrimesophilobacter sp.]